MDNITYRFAKSHDLTAIRALLTDCRLPTDGIEMFIGNCIVAMNESKVVGAVALEPCGRSALFRSLAVAPDCRGQSVGRGLFAKIVSHAHRLGIESLYLLTTDAEQYFAPLGFRRVERSEPPGRIQETSQFRSVCPKSAVCMRRDIR